MLYKTASICLHAQNGNSFQLKFSRGTVFAHHCCIACGYRDECRHKIPLCQWITVIHHKNSQKSFNLSISSFYTMHPYYINNPSWWICKWCRVALVSSLGSDSLHLLAQSGCSESWANFSEFLIWYLLFPAKIISWPIFLQTRIWFGWKSGAKF